ncbi:hypothetical protein [Erythrobacter sp. SG61-1L]|uniref:hypothetical protein n=1 Tax=Erythrobacter sp. SG61-1L TaxID=1603897 RepID=UPI0006C8F203|nr:hypothetical protein [Erythrobacter sp. SG61-1L]
MANLNGGKSTGAKLAGLAMRQGARIARHSLDKRLNVAGYKPSELEDAVVGRGIVSTIAIAAVTRLATRSVPGAIVVGGGLVAKALYERRKRVREAEEQAATEMAAAPEKAEEKGR